MPLVFLIGQKNKRTQGRRLFFLLDIRTKRHKIFASEHKSTFLPLCFLLVSAKTFSSETPLPTVETASVAYEKEFTTVETASTAYEKEFTTVETASAAYEKEFTTVETASAAYEKEFTTGDTISTGDDGLSSGADAFSGGLLFKKSTATTVC